MLIDLNKHSMVAEYTGEDEFEYDEVCQIISELMGDTEGWYAQMVGFGWKKLSGEKTFFANCGSALLRKTLPDTENHFRVYKTDTGFAINNVHHDSPIWGVEWYTIRKATEDEIASNT